MEDLPGEQQQHPPPVLSPRQPHQGQMIGDMRGETVVEVEARWEELVEGLVKSAIILFNTRCVGAGVTVQCLFYAFPKLDHSSPIIFKKRKILDCSKK